jgi:hypothetical protein
MKLSAKQQLIIGAQVAAALAAYVILYFRRCEASPQVSFNVLALSVTVLAVSLALTYWRTKESVVELSSSLRRFPIFSSIGLFMASLLIARFALNYSDAIGRPNWYKSVGLQCFAT